MYSDALDVNSLIAKYDREIADLLDQEKLRQHTNIELIASENIVSPAVLAAAGSVLTNKYAEGYPGHRYYGGCEYVDGIETLAIERAKKLFGADHANVQPHAGAPANMAAYKALLNLGDTILALDLSHGGHLTHGSPVNESGRLYNFVHYRVEEDTGVIDYDKLESQAREVRPQLILAGASAYSRIIDFERMKAIAQEVGAFFMVDMAHIAGLVAAGLHPSPVPFADIVTSTTHKTLRGPRGGLILSTGEFAQAVDKAVFPGLQGGPLMHIIAAKAVCFKEADSDEFRNYQKRIINNAAVLAESLTEKGIRLVSGGTDNHLMLLDLREEDVSGRKLEKMLDSVHITANKNVIPGETRKPSITSGLRLGTPAVTTRGFNEPEMRRIAEYIYLAIRDFDNKQEYIMNEVMQLCDAFPVYRD